MQSLLISIVQHEDVETAMRSLGEQGFKVTCISSIGGFLRAGNVTLVLGLSRQDIPRAIKLLSEHCHMRKTFVNGEPFVPAGGLAIPITPLEVDVGGATVFVMPVEQFVRIDAQRKVLTIEPEKRKQEPMRISMNMKLIMAIMPEGIADGVLDALIEAKHGATLVSTTGGLLRKGNATLLIGAEASRVEEAIYRIEQVCSERLPKVAGADPSVSIFVLDVEQYQSIGMEPMPAVAAETKPLPASA